ncbi:MAG: protein-disulfide reductase DsbD [Methyloglobulus sp.]|nr:protein-disulfide reductase DsbD [Methyloglobulus sp.]
MPRPTLIFIVLLSLLGQTGNAIESGELLPPEQVFKSSAIAVSPSQIEITWTVAQGYSLYRKNMRFETQTPGIQLGDPVFPAGTIKHDELLGDIEHYRGQLKVNLPITATKSIATAGLVIHYQGCADIGVCYPPQEKSLDVSFPAPTVAAPVSPVDSVAEGKAGLKPPQQVAPLSEQDQITQSLHNDSLWGTLVSFFGFGLLLSLTPCVFPMIPILSGIIVGRGHNITTSRAFLLSLSYVVASAFTYTVFGVLAALFGSNLQAAFQEPWIIGLFSGIFVLLSLSMFGFYNLDLPDFIRAKLHNSSEKHRDGSMLGAAIMGALSSLIVGPCVAAPLAGALIYIGQTGDAVLGGSALFVMGMGMGVPLLLVGASAGKLLPKAGSWLNATKAVFGVMMLGVAVWMLSRILPPEIIMLLWALLLILPAIYLNAVDSLPEHSSGWHKLWKGVGITLLAYGLLLLIGFSIGNTNPLKPLQGFGVTAVKASEQGLSFERVGSLAELEPRIKKANANHQPVMLDFYADWCISCKEMEAYTFTDANVKQTLAGFVLLQADVTKQSEADKALLTKFNLIGPPAILFFNGNEQETKSLRVIGYQDALTFIKTLQRVKS